LLWCCHVRRILVVRVTNRSCEPGLDRGDDGAKLDREQFDTDEGYSHEGVDDDALVEDAVDHLCEA
jgi:hypothetical protein